MKPPKLFLKPVHPKKYYYDRFRAQFAALVEKAHAHQHGNGETYLSTRDLVAENFTHIPGKDLGLFRCALACTVLVDQVVYTYFREDYLAFQEITRYPKIEYGFTGIHVHPWEIARDVDLNTLEQFFDFFVSDLEVFFTEHPLRAANWDTVKSAMLSDGAVVEGPIGTEFRRALESN